MEGIERVIECATIACRLEVAAYEKEQTAAALRRAAARYRRGGSEALAQMTRERPSAVGHPAAPADADRGSTRQRPHGV